MRSSILAAMTGTALAAGVLGAAAAFAVSGINTAAAPVADNSSSSAFCPAVDTMDRYACLIEAAAMGAAKDGVNQPIEAFEALAAMQTVQTLASSARYNYWQDRQDKFSIPNVTQQSICLDEGFGICGNHMLLFVDLMKRMGVPAQRVEFYYADPQTGQRLSHAAAQFKMGNKWRFVDITWGSIWLADKTDVSSWLSLDEVRNGVGHRLTSQLNPWYLSRREIGYDPFTYLGKGVDTIVDGDGVVNLPFIKTDGKFVANFSSIPTYIGDNKNDGEVRRVRLAIPDTAKGTMAVDIAGYSACGHSQIAFGSSLKPIAKGIVAFDDVAGGVLDIHGSDPACYVVLKGISIDAINS